MIYGLEVLGVSSQVAKTRRKSATLPINTTPGNAALISIDQIWDDKFGLDFQYMDVL
jgi:hypothetical protein